MGCVLPAGLGQNPARQAALQGGLPDTVSAMTINMVCGSGLKAVGLAAQAVMAGDAEVVVAGGMESMTNAPYLLPQGRKGFRMGDSVVVDSMVKDGLWCACEDYHMGMTGENCRGEAFDHARGAGCVCARVASEGECCVEGGTVRCGGGAGGGAGEEGSGDGGVAR